MLPSGFDTPLAEQMRPTCLEQVLGQEGVSTSLLGPLLQKGSFANLILWGPPGCGKTSIANVLAQQCRANSKWR